MLPTKVVALEVSDSFKYNLEEINTPWNISADRLNYEKKTGVYHLIGNVIISNKNMNMKINTDMIRIDAENIIIEPRENISVLIGDDYIFCKALKFDLKGKTGVIYNGSIFFKQNNLFIFGDKISKIDNSQYSIDRGFITTCSGKNQAWSITGKNISLEKEKHGIMRSAVFRVKQVPIFYLPYFIFPTSKRQSGLLSPKIRYSSKSLSYCQPIFLKINNSMDATFYPTYKSNGNWLIGLEFRYVQSFETKGLLLFDLCNSEISHKKKLYWLRSKIDKKLPANVVAKLGVNLISDIDYFENNSFGYSDFNRTNEIFRNFINKDLLPSNDLGSNYLVLNKTGSKYVFDTALYWNWNSNIVEAGANKSRIKPINKIASMQFGTILKQLSYFPLYPSLNIEYTKLDSKQEHLKYIARFQPNLRIPILLGNFASIDFSITSLQTIKKHNNINFEGKSYKHNFKLNLSSELSKIYKTAEKGSDAFKHSIGVQIEHEHNPKVKSLTYLCDPKYIDHKDLITLSLSNTLFAKYKDKTDQTKEISLCNYKKLAQFELRHIFRKKNEDKSSSNIEGKLYLSPNKNFTLQAFASFDVSNDCISMLSSELCTRNTNNACLSLGYFYRKKEVALLKTSIWVPFGKKLSTLITCGYDCQKSEKLIGFLGFYYDAQCWSTSVKYKKDMRDKSDSVSISIELLGLGSSEGKRSRLEKENINEILFNRKIIN